MKQNLLSRIGEGLKVFLFLGVLTFSFIVFATATGNAFLHELFEHPFDLAFRLGILGGLIAVALGWNWLLQKLFGEKWAEELALTAWIPIILLGSALFGFSKTIQVISHFFVSLWESI